MFKTMFFYCIMLERRKERSRKKSPRFMKLLNGDCPSQVIEELTHYRQNNKCFITWQDGIYTYLLWKKLKYLVIASSYFCCQISYEFELVVPFESTNTWIILQEMAKRFFPLCQSFLLISQFVESRSQFKTGLVNHAFAAALRELLLVRSSCSMMIVCFFFYSH